ncbi:hypothetical protein [Pontibacter sp. G13]|uniref:hypothetical protein n=1 Tax=Pontibacter sp. G13 TaxID=3074898 RepID=UPI00288C309C|nr:hypothetical protein [Pontibacter sp. G13]WNJ20032.1 hypothetical protein RJD25_06070 [Pontibacter sp. G13]
MKYFIVTYKGPFGFIKPWTAVRDSETFSQQFLTPSIVEGIEKKLFPVQLNHRGIEKILRHRLSYEQMSAQQEQIQPRGWNSGNIGKRKGFVRPRAVLIRSVLQNPTLHLAFGNEQDALQAFGQHICLCRNEDILLPHSIVQVSSEEFDSDEDRFSGFELAFGDGPESFLVGYNRYHEGEKMYGHLKVIGNPVSTV